MATTKVSICSGALLMLGKQPIASFTENSTAATLASNLYPAERRALMRRHPWNCLIERATLAASSTAPAFYYAAAFPLPADCIRLLSVGPDDDPADYRLEAGVILSSGTSLPIRYVADRDESEWDSQLVHLMTLRMAAVMAYPITKSASLADLQLASFKDALREAKGIDGQEDPPQDLGFSSLIAARQGLGG